MPDNSNTYTIGMVERDTGIGRDTLRIWERRYGFPSPARNDRGERLYAEWQLRRLQRIRRLLDQGLRPGKVLPLDEAALQQLESELFPGSAGAMTEPPSALLAAVRNADSNRVETLLYELYQQQGMQQFIVSTVVPLLQAVGQMWARGEIHIYQEHFLSEQLKRFLNSEISQLRLGGEPRILLATLPGEEHSLGLLMVAAILAAQQISVINLGSQVPLEQVVRAARQFQVNTVGLTFSASYPYKQIRADLQALSDALPADVMIWTGGEGVRRLRKLPGRVRKFTRLDDLPLGG